MAQREIKFRAWDVDSSTMITYDQLDNGEWFIGVPKKGLSLYCMHPDHDEPEERDAVLMQFTGLKNCWGVEIWEGDLIERLGFRYKVIFLDGSFCLSHKENSPSPLSEYCKLSKIIGNIYEHHELLES